MYLIDKAENRIVKMEEKCFSDLNFKERNHLQEWLAHEPSAFGEELLIIQKEFDGFEGTKERLDLLALDSAGNVVVIENKLDTTGRDVTGQALKYASYCSTLSKKHICDIYQEFLDKEGIKENAKQNLINFFSTQEYEELTLNKRGTQRIIIVAREFRNEVISNVLWLSDFNLDIKCLKATPYALNDQLFLTLEQILPIKNAEKYIISMTNKIQEEKNTEERVQEKQKLRLDFWADVLSMLKGKLSSFQNNSPSKDHWISSAGIGIAGVRYNLVLTTTYAAVQIEFSRTSQDENKRLFDAFLKHRDNIERDFGHQLEWNRNDAKKCSQVTYFLRDVSINNHSDWDVVQSFMVSNIIKLEKATEKPLVNIKQVLETSASSI